MPSAAATAALLLVVLCGVAPVLSERRAVEADILWRDRKAEASKVLFSDGVPLAVRPDQNGHSRLYRYDTATGEPTLVFGNWSVGIIDVTARDKHVYAVVETTDRACLVVRATPHGGAIQTVVTGNATCRGERSRVSVIGVTTSRSVVCVVAYTTLAGPGNFSGFSFGQTPVMAWTSVFPYGAPVLTPICGGYLLKTISSEKKLLLYSPGDGDNFNSFALAQLFGDVHPVPEVTGVALTCTYGDVCVTLRPSSEVLRVSRGGSVSSWGPVPVGPITALVGTRELYVYAPNSKAVMTYADAQRTDRWLFKTDAVVYRGVDVESADVIVFLAEKLLFVLRDPNLIATVPCEYCGPDTTAEVAGTLVYLTTPAGHGSTLVGAFDAFHRKFLWGPETTRRLAATFSAPRGNYALLGHAEWTDFVLTTNITETHSPSLPPTPTRTHTPSVSATPSFSAAATPSALVTPSLPLSQHQVDVSTVTRLGGAPVVLVSPWRTLPHRTASGETVFATACHQPTCAVLFTGHGSASIAVASIGGAGLSAPFPTLRPVPTTEAPVSLLALGIPGSKPTSSQPSAVFLVATETAIHAVVVGGPGQAIACRHSRIDRSGAALGVALVTCSDRSVLLLHVNSSGALVSDRLDIPASSSVVSLAVNRRQKARTAYVSWRVDGVLRLGYVDIDKASAPSGAVSPVVLWQGRPSGSVSVAISAQTTAEYHAVILDDTGARGVSTAFRSDWASPAVLAGAVWSFDGAGRGPIAVLMTAATLQLRALGTGAILADGKATWALKDTALETTPGTLITATFTDGRFVGTVPCGTACLFRFSFEHLANGTVRLLSAVRLSDPVVGLQAFCPAGPASSCSAVLRPKTADANATSASLLIDVNDATYAIPHRGVLMESALGHVTAAQVVVTDKGAVSISLLSPPPPSAIANAKEVDLDTVVSLPVSQPASQVHVLGTTVVGQVSTPTVVGLPRRTRRVLTGCNGASSVGPRSLSGGYVACFSAVGLLLHKTAGSDSPRSVAYHGVVPPCLVLLSKRRRWSSNAALVSEDIAVTGGARAALMDVSPDAVNNPSTVVDVGAVVLDALVDRTGRSALLITHALSTEKSPAVYAADAVAFKIQRLFKANESNTPGDWAIPSWPLLAIGSGSASATDSDYVLAIGRRDCTIAKSDVRSGNTTLAPQSSVSAHLLDAFGGDGSAPVVAAVADRPVHGRWPILGANNALCVMIVGGHQWAHYVPYCRPLLSPPITAAAGNSTCTASVLSLSDAGVVTVRLSSCAVMSLCILSPGFPALGTTLGGDLLGGAPVSRLADNVTGLSLGLDGMWYPLRLPNSSFGAGWALPRTTAVSGGGWLLTAQVSGIPGRVYVNRIDASALDAVTFAPAPVDGPASRLFPLVASLLSLPASWRPSTPLRDWSGNTCPETEGLCVHGTVSGGFLAWASPSLAGVAPEATLALSGAGIRGVVDLSGVHCFSEIALVENEFTEWVAGPGFTAKVLNLSGNVGMAASNFRVSQLSDTLEVLDVSRTSVVCSGGCLEGKAMSLLKTVILDRSRVQPPLSLAKLPPHLQLLSISNADLSALDLAAPIARIPLRSATALGSGGQSNGVSSPPPPWALRLSRSQLRGKLMATAPVDMSALDLSGNPGITTVHGSAAMTLHLCRPYGARCGDAALRSVDVSGTGISGWLDLSSSNTSGVVPQLRHLSVADTALAGDVDARGWAADLSPRNATLDVNVSGTGITAVIRDEGAALPAHLDIDVNNTAVITAPEGYACFVAPAFNAAAGNRMTVALYAGPDDLVTLIVPALVSRTVIESRRCDFPLQHWALTAAPRADGAHSVAFLGRFTESIWNCTAALEAIADQRLGGVGSVLEDAVVKRRYHGGRTSIDSVSFLFRGKGRKDPTVLVLTPGRCAEQELVAESWCSVISRTQSGANLQMQLVLNATASVLHIQRTGRMRELMAVTAVSLPITRVGAVDVTTWTWGKTALFPASVLFQDPGVRALLNPNEAPPGPCISVDGRVLQCDQYPFTFDRDCSGWAPIAECPWEADAVMSAGAIATQPDMEDDTPGDLLGPAQTITWRSCERVALPDRRPDGFLRLREGGATAVPGGCVPLTTFMPAKAKRGEVLQAGVQQCADPSSIDCVNRAPGNASNSTECGRLALQLGTQFTSCAMRGFDAHAQIAAEVSAASCVAASGAAHEAFDRVSAVVTTQTPRDVHVRPHCVQGRLQLYTCSPDDTAASVGALLYTIDTTASCWPRTLRSVDGTIELRCSPCLYYIDVSTLALPLGMLALSALKDIALMVLGTLILSSRRVRRFVAGIKGGIVIRALPYPTRRLRRQPSAPAMPALPALPQKEAKDSRGSALSIDRSDGVVYSDAGSGDDGDLDPPEPSRSAGLQVDPKDRDVRWDDTVNDDVDEHLDDLVRRLDPVPTPEIHFVNTYRLLSGSAPVDTVQAPHSRPHSPVAPRAAGLLGQSNPPPTQGPSPTRGDRSGASASLLDARSDTYGGFANEHTSTDNAEGARASIAQQQRTLAAEDKYAAAHQAMPLYQALVEVVLKKRRHNILNPTDPQVQAAWRAFVTAFESPDGGLRRCMELETHSRAHRMLCHYASPAVRAALAKIAWAPDMLRPCGVPCDVSVDHFVSEAEIDALAVLDAVVEREHCIAETAAIDRHFIPQPWMLVLKTVYAIFLFIICFARTLGRVYVDGWQHYEAFYFEFINSCTSVSLLTNALLRVWYTYGETGQIGIFVWISLAFVAAPLVTHIIPAVFLFPWLPLLVVVLTAALFVQSTLLTFAARRAPLQVLFKNVAHETKVRAFCFVAANVVSRLTTTFAVTVMLQSLFNYSVVFWMRQEHGIEYAWPGLPGPNTIPGYEWESRSWACFFRAVWSSVQQDGLALKTRVFSVFA